MSAHSAHCHCGNIPCRFTVMSPIDNVAERYFVAQQTPWSLRLSVVQILLTMTVQMCMYYAVLNYQGPQGNSWRAVARDWALHRLRQWFPGNSAWFWRIIDVNLMWFRDDAGPSGPYLSHPQGPAELTRVRELNRRPGHGPFRSRRPMRSGPNSIPIQRPSATDMEEMDCVIGDLIRSIDEQRLNHHGDRDSNDWRVRPGTSIWSPNSNTQGATGRLENSLRNYPSMFPASNISRNHKGQVSAPHQVPSHPVRMKGGTLMMRRMREHPMKFREVIMKFANRLNQRTDLREVKRR
jgi:hypothetical protein